MLSLSSCQGLIGQAENEEERLAGYFHPSEDRRDTEECSGSARENRQCVGSRQEVNTLAPSRPLERGWRKQKEGGPLAPQPKVRLRQEVVSAAGPRRGQRIAVPVRKLFAREKRPYGLGMVGRLTNRTYRKRIDSYVKRQIEDMDDHR